MFKVLIVLFVSTAAAPIASMVGEFPDRFASQKDCETFADKKRALLESSLLMVDSESRLAAKVIGSEISCVPDKGGMGI